MSEAALLKLLDISLTALSVGLERQAILDKVAALQKAGATPEQLIEGIVKLRDEAIASAQNKINAS